MKIKEYLKEGNNQNKREFVSNVLELEESVNLSTDLVISILRISKKILKEKEIEVKYINIIKNAKKDFKRCINICNEIEKLK